MTVHSVDDVIPTPQSNADLKLDDLYLVGAPAPTVVNYIDPIATVVPRGKTRKGRKSKATTSKEKLVTTTVTFGTTQFASEQTDSYGDITGKLKTTYYLKFTDKLPVSVKEPQR